MQTKLRAVKSFGKVIKWRNLVVAGVLTIGLFSNLVSTRAYAGAPWLERNCNDVIFIFARGSGEHIHDKSYQAWRESIEAQLEGGALKYYFYELGEDNKTTSYHYPATAVSGSFWGYVNLISTFFSQGKAFSFGKSVETGIKELTTVIKNDSEFCPRTKFVLGGYSQGAMLMTQALPQLDSEKILYVTNFGDPKLYLPEGSRGDGLFPKVPEACTSNKKSEYRIDVADCYAYEGVLGGQKPDYRPADFVGKVGLWCNNKDVMCSSGMSVDDHSKYIAQNMYVAAAEKIVEKIRSEMPEKYLLDPPTTHDVVILYDYGSAMNSKVLFYRKELLKLSEQVFAAGGRVALILYNVSVGDTTAQTQLVCGLRCSQADINYWLNRRYNIGTAMGEQLRLAVNKAVEKLEWNSDVPKTFVVAGVSKTDENNFPAIAQTIAQLGQTQVSAWVPEYYTELYRNLTDQTGGDTYGLGVNVDNYYITDESSALTDSAIAQIVARSLPRNDNKSNKAQRAKSTILPSNAEGNFVPAPELTIDQITYTRIGEDEMQVDFVTDAEYVFVVLNGAPAGFARVKDGKGEFAVGEIAHDLEATLIPYSQAGERSDTRGKVAMELTAIQNLPITEAPSGNGNEGGNGSENTGGSGGGNIDNDENDDGGQTGGTGGNNGQTGGSSGGGGQTGTGSSSDDDSRPGDTPDNGSASRTPVGNNPSTNLGENNTASSQSSVNTAPTSKIPQAPQAGSFERRIWWAKQLILGF